MIIGGSKFTPGTGTPLQPEMFLIICRQTDRQTDTHTHTHTHWQTDTQADRHNQKKLGKNQLQYLSLEAGIHHFDFLSLYCMKKEALLSWDD